MGRRRVVINKLARDEKGYALIAVLILLLLGSLLIPPLLGFMATGLKTGLMYEKKTDELYAADAGIEAGIWRVKYDCWGPDYDAYDFDTAWTYQTEKVNGMAANVTIWNVWIPSNVMLDELGLSPADARAIIESEKLKVVGGAIPGEYSIRIDFTPDEGDNLTVKSIGVWLPQGFGYIEGSCTLEDDDDPFDDYRLDSTDVSPCPGGQAVIWNYSEPYPLFTDFPGYSYENGSMSIGITFSYAPPAEHPDRLPAAIAWIATEMTDSFGTPKLNDVPISWDVDTRILKITSRAGDTSVDAYLTKCDLRQMGDAIAGDYVAIGNSLMRDTDGDNIRDYWYTSSSYALSTIPEDADVIAAYLYWAGWRGENAKTKFFIDTCSSSNLTGAWQNGGDWECDERWNDYYYRGQHTGDASRRFLTMKDSLDLSSYSSKVVVSWRQGASDRLEDEDGLDFAFSADGGSTWSSDIPAFRGDIGSSWEGYEYYYYFVPEQYLTGNFKLKFCLVGMGGDGEYCDVDDIRVSYLPPDTSITFNIDGQQVYLDGETPMQGNQPLTAGRSYVMPNELDDSAEGFSYACVRDVSELAKTYPIVGGEEYHTGNAEYTVGDVAANIDSHLSFAGWSLIIIYASPSTAGHYLYLRDNNFAFHTGYGESLDFDEDGKRGGDITNFVIPEPIKDKYGNIIETVAARLTCFVVEGDAWRSSDKVKITGKNSAYKYLSNPSSLVDNVWNGESYPGTFNEGIDIDTFEVLWDEGILMPEDDKLTIDMYSGSQWMIGDAYNLVYLILSVRSETVTSGTMYYMIGGG